MPITFDAVSSGTTFNLGDTGSTSFSHTTGSGSNRLLLVEISCRTFGSQTYTVTYDGVNLTQLSKISNAGLAVAEIWYLKNPASGTKTVQIVNSGATARGTVASRTYSGVDQSVNTFDTPVTATGTSNAISNTISSATGDLVVDCVTANHTDTTLTCLQTQRWNVQFPGNPKDQYGVGGGSEKAGAASVNMAWNLNATEEWASVGASVRQLVSNSFVSWIWDGVG